MVEYGEIKEELLEKAKAIGAPKLVLAAVIIALLAWGLFLRPFPGSLSVSVVELDSGDAVVGAQVDVISSESGEIIYSDYTDESGAVEFKSVPSGRELLVEVAPGGKYAFERSSVTLESRGASSLEVEVARDWKLKVEATRSEFNAGAGCLVSVELAVTNEGDAPVPLEFVASGGLAGATFEARTLNARTRETFTVLAAAPEKEGETAGALRVKYTNEEEAFTINVVDAPTLGVSPASIDETIPTGSSGFVEYLDLTLQGEGKGIELEASCKATGADLAGKVSITDTNPDSLLSQETPKRFKLLFGPFNTGSYGGQLVCETSCGKKTINVQVTK
ncbi:MAG: carboxypeptidase-like regulatory domain-containing protein [Candidatus Micrarchaeia archaeon]